MNHTLHYRFIDSLSALPAASWNALVDADSPMLRHEFLYALEQTGCTNAASGWSPRHLLLERGQKLVAAVPLYSKEHSYGEYVFDWAWADAYHRAGLTYYPKLVAGVPFTPVTGQRIVTRTTVDSELTATIRTALLELAAAEKFSSIHWLFPDALQAEQLTTEGWLHRTAYQFHWHNQGHREFDEFIGTFSAKKRKNIRRERRRVSEAGIRVEAITGATLTPELWRFFYRCYRNTTTTHGAIPYLNQAFFTALGSVMSDACLLFVAFRDAQPIAASLCLKGENSLYGRYWGAVTHQDSLHFELCYYAPIEYCLQQGLARFEAGAQGEHKLSRGFLPTETHSLLVSGRDPTGGVSPAGAGALRTQRSTGCRG